MLANGAERKIIRKSHRGACGIFPDHTIASYQRAIQDGADFVELFNDKKATYNIDGTNTTGIFSFDLTLAEIKQLRAIQPLAFRNQAFNGMYQVLTLEEYLDVIQGANRTVGIYPETKHPSFHDSLGLQCFGNGTFTDAVLEVLESRGYTGPYNSQAWLQNPVFIQSFERKNLMDLKSKTSIPLIQLMDEWDLPVPYDSVTYGDLATPDGLKEIATYAKGIGPWKGSYVVVNASNYIESIDADFVENAHAAGLQLHPYTFRNEQSYLAWDYETDINKEYDLHFSELGIDGAFTDYAGTLHRYLHGKLYQKPTS
ncbi:hypothetical protein N2152v2_000361 [Parachlorella kessleri]